MKYHDFRLRSYTISDLGATLSLDLIYDYHDQPIEISEIVFSEVLFHHFIHLGGAIITDVFQISLSEATNIHHLSLTQMNRLYGGIPFSESDDFSLISKIESEGYSTWMIEAAIGFSGFVVAKTVSPVKTEQGAAANP